MAWTDEMVAELKRLWAEGVTTGEIGRRLNISKNSIVGKVHRLGLSGRPSPIKKKGDEEPIKRNSSKSKSQPKKKEETSSKKDQKAEQSQQKNVTKTKPENKSDKKVEAKHSLKTSSPTDEEADIKLAQSLNLTESKNKNSEFLHLTDLDNHTCRWPIGDPKDENFHFCGKKVKMGQTYCEEHSAIAYVKPSKK